jgi:hypothetical protein
MPVGDSKSCKSWVYTYVGNYVPTRRCNLGKNTKREEKRGNVKDNGRKRKAKAKFKVKV